MGPMQLHLDVAPTSEHLHIALKKAAYRSSNQSNYNYILKHKGRL